MAETTEFNCQTATCQNEFAIIMLWVGESTAQYLCPGCWAAACLKIIETLSDQGDLPLGVMIDPGPAAAAAPAAAAPPPHEEQLPDDIDEPGEQLDGRTECKRCDGWVTPGFACPMAGARGCAIPAPALA